MNEWISFGETLRTFRKKRKVSQRALAMQIGVHYNTIWAWEQGDYLPNSKGIILELAQHLHLKENETHLLLRI